MSSITGSRTAALAAAFVCLVSSPVLAVPWASSSAVVFKLSARNSLGRGSFEATFGQGLYNEATQRFAWSLLSPVTIFDTDTNLPIAKLLSANVEYIADPVVNLSFQVQAGPGPLPTEVEIFAALLPFPAINPAHGRASAGITVTDNDSNGASVAGLVAGGGSYLAQYNGLVPGGTTFAQLLPSIIAGPGESNALAASTPGGGAFTPIAGSVFDMSSEFHFNLSASDLASGTSHWEVVPVPAPSVVAVLLLGVAGLARRRRSA